MDYAEWLEEVNKALFNDGNGVLFMADGHTRMLNSVEEARENGFNDQMLHKLYESGVSPQHAPEEITAKIAKG